VATDNLYLRAGELLAYAADLLPGVQRAYVALAQPALDCPDQLTVHVAALARQAAGAGVALPDFAHGLATQIATTNQAAFVVTIVRCVPTAGDSGTPPSTLDYEAASLAVLGDLWLLWKGIPAGVRNGELWQGCEQAILGPATPVAESGGFAGWQIPVTGEVFDA
jgi:hypothetical protein